MPRVLARDKAQKPTMDKIKTKVLFSASSGILIAKDTLMVKNVKKDVYQNIFDVQFNQDTINPNFSPYASFTHSKRPPSRG